MQEVRRRRQHQQKQDQWMDRFESVTEVWCRHLLIRQALAGRQAGRQAGDAAATAAAHHWSKKQKKRATAQKTRCNWYDSARCIITFNVMIIVVIQSNNRFIAVKECAFRYSFVSLFNVASLTHPAYKHKLSTQPLLFSSGGLHCHWWWWWCACAAPHRSAALKTQEAASFKTFKFFILDVSPNMECKTLNRYLLGQYFTKPLLLQLISGRSINQRLFLASCCWWCYSGCWRPCSHINCSAMQR